MTTLKCRRCKQIIEINDPFLMACGECLAELERRIPLTRILEGYDDSEALHAFWTEFDNADPS